MEFEVLNGTVRVGDKVAFAVRDGNLAAMRIGKVVGYEERKQPYSEDDYVIRLKVRVSRSSSYYGTGGSDTDYVAGIEKLDRVVKL